MNIAGIVAEYNPFHNGHAHHIKVTRENGADAIIAVMSGNFVQRCEASILDKYNRAKIAVLNGVDLVLELPLRFSIASAKDFAYGGVQILNSTGVVNILSFGSESGSEKIIAFKKALEEAENKGLIKEYVKTGISFALARQKAISDCGIDNFDNPNDILAVEYLNAIDRLNSSIIPFSVNRIGGYHSLKPEKNILGATAIRNRIFSGEDFMEYMPESAYKLIISAINEKKCPAGLLNLERGILHYFRTVSPEDIKNYYAVREGLEYRITEASGASSLTEFYSKIKTKRYALSAVRRAVLCSFLRIYKNLSSPPYLRVLAFNDIGRGILKEMKTKASLPVFQILTPEMQNDENFRPFVKEALREGDVYSLTTPRINGKYIDFLINSIYVKNI